MEVKMSGPGKWRTKLNNVRKAMKIVEVIKETGSMNLTEAHRRYYPKDSRPKTNCGRMMNEDIMDVLFRMLHADDEALAKLGAGDVVKDIITDINRINVLLDNATETDEVAKLLSVKTHKQKMLGAFLGIWKADKIAPVKESDPDAIFEKNRNRLGASDGVFGKN